MDQLQDSRCELELSTTRTESVSSSGTVRNEGRLGISSVSQVKVGSVGLTAQLGGNRLVRWQQETENDMRNTEVKLRKDVEVVDSQREQIIQMKRQNEAFLSEMNRVEEDNKMMEGSLTSTKVEVKLMSRQLEYVIEQLGLLKEERREMILVDEERKGELQSLEIMFNQLKVQSGEELNGLQEIVYEKSSSVEETKRKNFDEGRAMAGQVNCLEVTLKEVDVDVSSAMIKLEGKTDNINNKLKNVDNLKILSEKCEVDMKSFDMEVKRKQNNLQHDIEAITLNKENVEKENFNLSDITSKINDNIGCVNSSSDQTNKVLEDDERIILEAQSNMKCLELEEKKMEQAFNDRVVEIDDLNVQKSEIDNVKDEFRSLQICLEECNEQKSKSESEVAFLKRVREQKFELEEEKVKLSGRLSVLDIKVSKLIAKKSSMKSKLEKISEDMKVTENEASSIIVEKSEILENINQCNLKLKGLQDKLARAKHDLMAKKKDLQDQTALIESCTNTNLSISSEVNELKRSKDSLEDEVKSSTELLNAAILFNVGLTNDIQKIRDNLEMETLRLNNLNADLIMGNTRLDNIEKEEKCTDTCLLKLKEEEDCIRKEKESINMENISIDEELDTSETICASINCKAEATEAAVNLAETELNSCKNNKELNFKMKSDHSAKEKEVKKLETELKKANRNMDTVIKKKEKLERQFEKTKANHDKVISDCNKTEKDNGDMIKMTEDVNKDIYSKEVKLSEFVVKEVNIVKVMEEKTSCISDTKVQAENIKGELRQKEQSIHKIYLENDLNLKEFRLVLEKKCKENNLIIIKMEDTNVNLESKVKTLNVDLVEQESNLSHLVSSYDPQKEQSKLDQVVRDVIKAKNEAMELDTNILKSDNYLKQGHHARPETSIQQRAQRVLLPIVPPSPFRSLLKPPAGASHGRPSRPKKSQMSPVNQLSPTVTSFDCVLGLSDMDSS